MDVFTEEHHRRLERMYLNAPINKEHYPNTEISVGDGKATIRTTIDESFYHAMNAVHGSVYFKLLDDAAFFAVNALVRDAFVLTTSFHVHFIRPITSGTVSAKGEARFVSREQFIAEATLYNDRGKEVGFGTGHFAKSTVPLKNVAGYQ